MGTTWTKEQLNAICDKGNNILVAAAAGSGKTTVLVERIIRKIIDDGIDIDKMLVVTFTNAAASEMRERILNAIYSEIEKDPLNQRLRKQIVLLNKSSICTIDSFCLDVIKNNFFEIGVSSNFRIADNTELDLLRQEAIEETFEDLYLNDDKNFQKLIEIYSGYKDDENLKNIILKIYNFVQSAPFPEDWLEEKTEIFKAKQEENFTKTIWGEILIKNFKDELQNSLQILKSYKRKLEMIPELSKSLLIIEDDINQLENLDKSLENWDAAYEIANNLKFKTWQADKKVISQLKDETKNARDNVKKRLTQSIEKTFIYTGKEAIEDMTEMYESLKMIKNITLQFIKKFGEKKSEKNIMDFSDIEHNALKILLRKNEKGLYEKSEIAKKYEEKFNEIAIDEYQDSNLVQEYILTSISNGKNIFMVGDVKQSIYRFRQARPELFLNKYENYGLIPNELGQKIQLFKNFRSRKNILDVTNLIFEDIMSKEFGEIAYDESEYLNLGANYEEPEKECEFAGKAELDIIDLKEEQNENEEEIEESTEELLEKTEIEAKFVAKKIRQLIDSKYQVYDRKKGYRNIEYKDIVILLRATSNVANIFEKELINNEIPVFSDQADNYLESIEIRNIIALFKIIDNPYRDIPLVTVMRSVIGDFTDNELIEIRLCQREGYYYDSVKAAVNSNQIKETTKEKLKKFVNKIEKWREEEKYLPLNEFVWKIYKETDYYNYVRLMPNGQIRKANLKMLFDRAKEYEKISFKGLFNFIRYLEKIKNNNSDLASAKLIGENENVVRIMSIHKSKGLEFPVAIISRTDKKFNQKDQSDQILMHQDIGFGMQYINYDRKIEYTTAAKEAIKIKIKEESIAEEMRILYVALTRAKEKLIITGIENDLEKSLEQKRELIQNYEKENGKINHLVLKKFLSYLEWIELTYLNHENIDEYITLNKINKKEILDDKEVEKEHREKKIISNPENLEKINQILNWKYDYQEMTNIQSKMSVTKIKELKTKELIKHETPEIKPKFMEEKKSLTGAEKGTLVHLILQKLDLKKEYNKKEIEEVIEKLYKKQIINKIQKESVNIEKIYKILSSPFFEKIKKAKQIKKETPFYTYIDTKEIYNTEKSENILVQGIIDLYYINDNDEVVLIDYKTDYVEKEYELIEKYKVQLEIYKKALEESLNTKINEIYIYSIWLNKEVKIEEI
ncbi:MAG: helicase-exonuclease AddAB subunit AddA [Clostridia bacterium]|nr:helicase-exonuclease AddAB subunit AddA [Clostridia bacterium]